MKNVLKDLAKAAWVSFVDFLQVLFCRRRCHCCSQRMGWFHQPMEITVAVGIPIYKVCERCAWPIRESMKRGPVGYSVAAKFVVTCAKVAEETSAKPLRRINLMQDQTPNPYNQPLQ